MKLSKVRALKFSKMWVGGLLRRNALRRRRITASEKVLPDPAAVQAQMSQIQQTIEDDNYTPAEIISADETGVFYGAAPKHLVVPGACSRGRRALLFLLFLLLLLLLTRRTLVVRVGAGRRTKKEIPT